MLGPERADQVALAQRQLALEAGSPEAGEERAAGGAQALGERGAARANLGEQRTKHGCLALHGFRLGGGRRRRRCRLPGPAPDGGSAWCLHCGGSRHLRVRTAREAVGLGADTQGGQLGVQRLERNPEGPCHEGCVSVVGEQPE